MKKALALIAALLTSAGAYAQGQVNFLTVVGPAANRVVFAPVSRPGAAQPGQGEGAGAGYTAQLFVDNAGTLTALTPATTFRTDSAGASFFVLDPGTPVTVPGFAPGTSAPLVFRAWETSAGSYEAATIKGESRASIALGGGLLPPTNLVGLQGFVMVPEPSTITLGVLGAAALLLRRRK
jgi:hypothetical protein